MVSNASELECEISDLICQTKFGINIHYVLHYTIRIILLSLETLECRNVNGTTN